MKRAWPEFTLNNVCTRITDGAHHSPKSVEQGLPMASVKDLTPHGINLETCRLISEEDFAKLVRQGCQPEISDVLIAKDGASALDTVCEMKQKLEVVLLSSVAILRPDPEKATSTFLRYYLDSEATRHYMKGAFITGAAIPRVILEDFRRAAIRLPPLPTQHKIAAILSAYDDLIENNTRRIAILEEMAQALYREWFVHFRFPGHNGVRMVESELGPVPERWKKVELEELYRTSSGGTPSRKVPEYYDNGTISWLKTRELNDSFILGTEEKITELGLRKSSAKLFPPNTVIMAMYGATIGKLGILAQSAATNQACCAIMPRNGVFRHAYVFFYLLQNREKLISLGMGAAQQNISQQVIKKFEMLKPTNEIVQEFNSIVDPILESIRVLQAKNANLRQARDLLLPRLISGELDVSGLEVDTEGLGA